MRVLWEHHRCIVLDYSLLRVWSCKERYIALCEKLHERKLALEAVAGQAIATIGRILPASVFFAEKVGEMRAAGVESSIISVATSCVAFLEMMHVRGMTVHQEVMAQLHALNNHEDLNALLHGAGFVLATKDADSTNATGVLLMMLNRVSNAVGYNHPVPKMQSRDAQYKVCFDFTAIPGSGRHAFTAAGRVCDSSGEATEIAAYNALLALSVNCRVQIGDLNRDAYLFCRGRVLEIGAELELLANSGSSYCSYFNATYRGLRMLLNSSSHLFPRHSIGQELFQRLRSVTSEVQQCLTAISAPVVLMNEDAIVGAVPF